MKDFHAYLNVNLNLITTNFFETNSLQNLPKSFQ
jgi:hypothetical protein